MNNYTLIAIDKTNNTTYTHKRTRNYFSNCNFNLGTIFYFFYFFDEKCVTTHDRRTSFVAVTKGSRHF